MPREGCITLGDLEGRLTHVEVACRRCDRRGRYGLAKLLATHGPDAKVPVWLEEVRSACARSKAHSITERCVANIPDLSRAMGWTMPGAGTTKAPATRR